MRKLSLALLSVMALGGLAAAQVPAPDFWIDPVFLTPNATLLEFHVQGPPSSAVLLYTTPDDPFAAAAPRRIRRFHSTQLDGTGHATFTLPLQWQGPLPDVWFGALVRPPAQPAVRANVVHLAGAFAFALMTDSASVIDYKTNTGQLDVRVATTPGANVSIWVVDCGLLPPEPAVGSPFDTLQSGVSYVGGGVADASGGFAWSGTESGARCIVVIANGIIVGVKRSH